MKTIVAIVFFSILSLSLVFSSQALSIQQQTYGFSYDGMASEGGQNGLLFVVCGTVCDMPQYVRPVPKDLSLSIKLSQNVVEETRPATKSVPLKPPQANEKAPSEEKDPAVTVLFALDSSLIAAPERIKLSTFITEANRQLSKQINATVTVEGYTCDLGNESFNSLLARKRAVNVVSYLEKAGIHPSEVSGKGKCCYVTKDHNKRYLNRRVEVKMRPKEGKQ